MNYIKATEYAVNRLHTLPLCNRLIKETQAVLMEKVWGQEKSPGEFRISQNRIGGQCSTLKTARYIPPCPEDMDDAMHIRGMFEKEVDIESAKVDIESKEVENEKVDIRNKLLSFSNMISEKTVNHALEIYSKCGKEDYFGRTKKFSFERTF